jgi:hypothetical protein
MSGHLQAQADILGDTVCMMITAMMMKITMFEDVKLCGEVACYLYFGGAYCLPHTGRRLKMEAVG